MLKGFEKFKRVENKQEAAYRTVEYKLSKGEEPTLSEIRLWFIEGTERFYNTKLLGTQVNYCYNTFNKVKSKYKLCNHDLCLKLIKWRENYSKLGTGKIFDFSSLNTDWIIDKLENNGTNRGKRTSYLDQNNNRIDTSSRRI